jgi:hypothetical protein
VRRKYSSLTNQNVEEINMAENNHQEGEIKL